MSKPWREIKHKGAPSEQARRDLEKQYNRWYWRLVRLWDRFTGRLK